MRRSWNLEKAVEKELQAQHTIWTILPNGNVLHRSGLELESKGNSWQMTHSSGVDFAVFTMMEHGLSPDEAQGLADLLIQQGATWASGGGLH